MSRPFVHPSWPRQACAAARRRSWQRLRSYAAERAFLLATQDSSRALVARLRLRRTVPTWRGSAAAAAEMQRTAAVRGGLRRGLRRWRAYAAAMRRVAAATLAATQTWRRLAVAHLCAWRLLTRQLQSLEAVRARVVGRLAAEHLVAWRALAARRAATRARDAQSRAALLATHRADVLRVWRGAVGARRAVAALKLCWLEAVVVACWRAWRHSAQATRLDTPAAPASTPASRTAA